MSKHKHNINYAKSFERWWRRSGPQHGEPVFKHDCWRAWRAGHKHQRKLDSIDDETDESSDPGGDWRDGQDSGIGSAVDESMR